MVVKIQNKKRKITRKEVEKLFYEINELKNTVDHLRNRLEDSGMYRERFTNLEKEHDRLMKSSFEMSSKVEVSSYLLKQLEGCYYSLIKDEGVKKYALKTLKYPKYKLFELGEYLQSESYKKDILEIAYSSIELDSDTQAQELAKTLKARKEMNNKPKPIAPLERERPKLMKAKEGLER